MKKLALLALLALGLSLLAACSLDSGPTAPNTVAMGGATFNPTSITIKKGVQLTFMDEQSGSPHVLVNGQGGDYQPENGAPDFGGKDGHSIQPGQSWSTPPWTMPGTYHVTCTIHPNMNLTVTVTS